MTADIGNAEEAHQASGERWKQVWESRDLAGSVSSTLSRLLAADGFDTPYASLDEASWVEFVERGAGDLRIEPGMSVFDVGCGAGAFLHVLRSKGCTVAGIDWSPNLVEIAREVMPDGKFRVCEARDLELHPPADVVVSCSTFLYFPSLDYARSVVERMVAKANRAVAIFDLPDMAKKDAALEYRKAMAGGASEYAARYEGLEHRYYDRVWFADTLRAEGLTAIEVRDQDLANYGNAKFRFNAWGFKAASRSSR